MMIKEENVIEFVLLNNTEISLIPRSRLSFDFYRIPTMMII